MLVSETHRIYDWSTEQFSGWSMKKVLTTCGYCGCGCNLYLTVEGGRITGVLPKPDHPVSQGMLCSKGWQGHGFARHPDRLDQPLLRQEDGTLKGVSWSEAYRAIAQHLRSVIRAHGPDSGLIIAKTTGLAGCARTARATGSVAAPASTARRLIL